MAFQTLPRQPEHIHLPAGRWLGGSPLDGLKAAGLPPTHPHHVEIDCSTGMIGYTRYTAAEIAAKHAEDAAHMRRAAELVAAKDADLAILRGEAASNPAFAALLRHLGVE